METIVLPVETKVREFDGKLWLGMNFVSRGKEVILGPSDEIRNTVDVTEPDVYITKDPGDSNIDFFKRLRSAGISVCGLDTEGGVFDSISNYSINKRKVLNYLDAFFAWGERPAIEIRNQYENMMNIHVTGNPRFDLLQPHLRFIYQNRAKPINERYGDYILLNGNFSRANPDNQGVITKSEEIYGSAPEEEHTYKNRIFNLFLDAIYHLQAKFPETDIIIRPHPSENNTTYEEAFQRCDHVHIEDTGDVRNWIAGASVTVHHDCTTGIESALMGTPVVSYRPIQNKEYEAELPQVVSKQALTLENLTEYISKSLNRDKYYEMTTDQTTHLKQYFHNIDESAAEKMCDVISSLDTDNERNYAELKPDLKQDIERRVQTSVFSDEIITLYDKVHLLLGNESPQKQRQYRKQKFTSVEKEEILQLIQQIEQVLDINPVSVEEVSMTNNTFYIRPE